MDASIDPGLASPEINDLTAELAGSQFDEADGSTAIVPEATDHDLPVQVENPRGSDQLGDQGIEEGPPDVPGEHGEPLGSLIEDAKPETTATDESATPGSTESGQQDKSSDDRIPTLPKRSGFGLSRMLAAAQTVFTEADDPEAETSSNPDDEGLPEELPSWAITDEDDHSSELVASFESLSEDKAEIASEPSVLESDDRDTVENAPSTLATPEDDIAKALAQLNDVDDISDGDISDGVDGVDPAADLDSATDEPDQQQGEDAWLTEQGDTSGTDDDIWDISSIDNAVRPYDLDGGPSTIESSPVDTTEDSDASDGVTDDLAGSDREESDGDALGEPEGQDDGASDLTTSEPSESIYADPAVERVDEAWADEPAGLEPAGVEPVSSDERRRCR